MTFVKCRERHIKAIFDKFELTEKAKALINAIQTKMKQKKKKKKIIQINAIKKKKKKKKKKKN